MRPGTTSNAQNAYILYRMKGQKDEKDFPSLFACATAKACCVRFVAYYDRRPYILAQRKQGPCLSRPFPGTLAKSGHTKDSVGPPLGWFPKVTLGLAIRCLCVDAKLSPLLGKGGLRSNY